MAPRPHILVVNGRKVRQPVFVIGAPHSGRTCSGARSSSPRDFTSPSARRRYRASSTRSPGSPSIQRGRTDAAATVLRDAFAQGWQVNAHGCLTCSPLCRDAGRSTGAACCVDERDILRYGDASPDLMYCAEGLVDAFADARLIQLIRDGRDVVAAMLADPQAMAWFKPSMVKADGELPNPFYGIETEEDRASWQSLSVAGRSAMRWRGTVRAMARLRASMSAEQLTTLRYEDIIKHPGPSAAAVSAFIGSAVSPVPVKAARRERQLGIEPGSWRKVLTPAQIDEIELVAGPDLLRVGYGR